MAEKKFFIIVNPAAGKKNSARQVAKDFKEYLDSYGSSADTVQYHIEETQYGGHGTSLVAQAREGKYTDLVVIGGDGTLNDVVNGVTDHSLTMSVLPSGTGNDFCKTLGWPQDRELQFKSVLHGPPMLIDLGVCNKRRFINTMGLGFDGKVVDTIEKYGKQINGELAYLYATVKEFFAYKEPRIRFNWEGGSEESPLFLMAINNGKIFGGGFNITPKAELDDGLLDVCLVQEFSIWRRFSHLPKVYAGKHQGLKGVKFFQTKRITIEECSGVIGQVDGEYLGEPPFEVRLLPNAIRIRSGLE